MTTKNKKTKTTEDTLEMLEASLIKEFGPESAMRLNASTTLSNIKHWASTRSIVVDKVLAGGRPLPCSLMPYGRQTEISGPPGSGKCLVGNTYVTTKKGTLTIEELFEHEGIVASCSNKITPVRTSVLNRFGKWEETSHFTNNNRRRVKKITTRSGNCIETTNNHPHLVMSKMGNWIWKNTRDLEKGDFLISLTHSPDLQYLSKEPDDLAYALGVLIADGHFGENRVSLTNDDQDVVDISIPVLSSLFGKEPSAYPNNDNGSFQYHYNSKNKVKEFYEKFGFIPGRAASKNIPKVLRKKDTNFIRELLSGYIDCESYINEKGIEAASASHELLKQVKVLLTQFGVHSTIRKKIVDNTDYWKLTISGRAVEKYINNVGSRSSKVLSGLQESVNKTGPSLCDFVPNIKNLIKEVYDMTDFTTREHNRIALAYDKDCITYDRLGKILELEWTPSTCLSRLKEIYFRKDQYVYDEVVYIEDGGEVPTFDLAVPGSHSFIANGLVTHNTTLCAQLSAEVQSQGGIVVVTDTEERIAHDYWQALGVDTSRIINLRAYSIEEVFEKQHACIEVMAKNSPDTEILMIWDSLGATAGRSTMTPAKNESFMEAARKNMGRDAGMISAGMRVINGAVAKARVMYVYTNHIYSKMNVTYGDKTETYGGVKAKFFATVRLSLQQIGKIKQEDKLGNVQVIGNRVRVKTLKNNMSPFLMEKEAVVLGGIGFSNDYTAFEAGKKLGLLTSKGAWSTVVMPSGEEIKFQGWNGFMTKVVPHPQYPDFMNLVREAL